MPDNSLDEFNRIAGYAKSIEQVTRILDSEVHKALQAEKETAEMDKSGFVLAGLTISTVVLTALAAELILKAWSGRTKGKYPKVHDLRKLMDQLDGEVWNLFQIPEINLIRSAFERHSNDFTHWRYLFENVDSNDKTKHPDPKMTQAVRLLIDKYFTQMTRQLSS